MNVGALAHQNRRPDTRVIQAECRLLWRTKPFRLIAGTIGMLPPPTFPPSLEQDDWLAPTPARNTSQKTLRTRQTIDRATLSASRRLLPQRGCIRLEVCAESLGAVIRAVRRVESPPAGDLWMRLRGGCQTSGTDVSRTIFSAEPISTHHRLTKSTTLRMIRDA